MRHGRDSRNTVRFVRDGTHRLLGLTHGSAISRSVSLMILFGSAMVKVETREMQSK